MRSAWIVVAAVVGAGAVAPADEKRPSVTWERSLPAGLAEAKVTGRPILLNFWCGT